jgi:DNA-binding transcriptional LysR family regulator
MPDLSLRELECFSAVAEELNFTAAARRLHLSQPPLSRHIASLEAKLGAALFLRTRRSVRLTAAGERFRLETQGVLPQLERAEAAVRQGGWERGERLEVGFVSALLSAELMAVFEAFHAAHPEVRVTLHDRLPAAQLEELKAGILELGFVGLAPARHDRAIVLHPWRRERLCAYLPQGHRLAGKASVAVRELAEEPLAWVSGEAAPAFAARLRQLFAAAGILPRVVQEASRAQAVAMMAVGGSAIALLPESVGGILPRYQPLPLSDVDGREVWLDFVLASTPALSPAGQRFLACARAVS